jgi:hypothetical protein
MLVLGAHLTAAFEEDEMYMVLTDQLAAQRIADLRREAEHDRLGRARPGGRRARRRRAVWVRWAFRPARPARA